MDLDFVILKSETSLTVRPAHDSEASPDDRRERHVRLVA